MSLFMGPGGAYSPRYIYVDGKFSADSVAKVRLQRLLVSSEHISWRDKSMEFDRVSAFAFFVLPVSAANQLMGYMYSINLYSDNERLHVGLFGMKKDKETPSAFQITVAALRRHIEPRLFEQTLRRIDQGEQIKIGAITFSRDGLRRKGFFHSKFAAWSSTIEIHPPSLGTAFASTQYIHTRDTRNRQHKIGEVGSATPNGILASTLIDICTRRYSTA
jgi:hypothetical protein